MPVVFCPQVLALFAFADLMGIDDALPVRAMVAGVTVIEVAQKHFPGGACLAIAAKREQFTKGRTCVPGPTVM